MANGQIHDWGKWKFSDKNKDKVAEFCAKHANNGDFCLNWHKLMKVSIVSQTSVKEPDVSVPDVQSFVDDLIESLDQEVIGSEFETLSKQSNCTKTKIISKLSEKLDPPKFIKLCKIICENKLQLTEVNDFLSLLILPKVLENEESSSYLLHALQQLAVVFSERVSQLLLIPLVCDRQHYNTDLVNNIFQALTYKDKNTFTMCLMKKPSLKNCDWSFLQIIINTTSLTEQCLETISICLKVHSKEMCKSQIYSKVLLTLAQHSQLSSNCKNNIREAASVNETLLKKQIFKYLVDF